jgi:hypothetical protein
MSVSAFESENVAGQKECSNQAATIGQKLDSADGARQDLIDIFRRFGFCENLAAYAIPEPVPERPLSDDDLRLRFGC